MSVSEPVIAGHFVGRSIGWVARLRGRSRSLNRVQKVLEDANVKLGSVASDPLGGSGRAMIRALIEGCTDPEALAELARCRLREKIPELREALRGRKRALIGVGHALLVIVYHVLSKDEGYRDLGADHFDRLQSERLTRSLVRRLEQLGHKVTLESNAA